MPNPNQQFRRGDMVMVARNLGPHMTHFRGGEEAIVMGSYADQFGGDDIHDFTVMFITDGAECSWYHDFQLTFIVHVGEVGIVAVNTRREERVKQQSDLQWIVDNWKRTGMPPASIQALADMCGLGSLWGKNGEGMTWYINYHFIHKLFNRVMCTKDIAQVRAKIHRIKEAKENAQSQQTSA